MAICIVWTSDGYLCPRDGDVGWTGNQSEAGHFLSQQEAEDTAEGLNYEVGEYKVIPLSSAPEKLNRN